VEEEEEEEEVGDEGGRGVVKCFRGNRQLSER
jgi:hypothetical protein